MAPGPNRSRMASMALSAACHDDPAGDGPCSDQGLPEGLDPAGPRVEPKPGGARHL